MTTSLRWGHVVLAMLALQVGCCSIHVDYDGPHHKRLPLCADSSCVQDACVDEGACKINGLGHIGHSLHTLHDRATCGLKCGSGCGELYFDEYINEPPVCDPCGCNNEWVGGYRECRPWYSRIRDLWGYKYPGSQCTECTDCTHGGIWMGESESYGIHREMGEEVLSTSETGTVVAPISKMDGTPTPAKPKAEPRLLPGDSESTPASILDREPASGKSAQSKKRSGEPPSRVAASNKKVPATPTSGRRKLTTQPR
jgi:hypothetical protein